MTATSVLSLNGVTTAGPGNQLNDPTVTKYTVIISVDGDPGGNFPYFIQVQRVNGTWADFLGPFTATSTTQIKQFDGPFLGVRLNILNVMYIGSGSATGEILAF